MPVERVGEHAAEQYADASRRRTATKPKTPIALARSAGSVNSVIISESATARRDRAAETLHGASRDQQALRVGETAGQRRER